MAFKNRSVKQKLMIIILFTSSVVLILTSVAFISYEWFTFRKSLAENVRTLSQVIAGNSTAALAFNNPGDAFETLRALKAEANITRAALFDENGNLFAWYPHEYPASGFPGHPGVPGYKFVKDHLVVYEPVAEGDRVYGVLYMEAGLNIIYQRLRLYAGIVFLILFVSLLAAFFLSTNLQKSVSEPVLALSEAATRISEKKDYSVRVAVTTEDELGQLTRTFNEMLAQVQASDAGLRRALQEKDVLIQEIHHRVKNNLQVILSLFDMQTRYMNNADPKEVFDDCRFRVRSMSLVHEMLYSASDFSQINFEGYVERLVRDVTRFYRPGNSAFESEVELKGLEIDIGRAVPLGLVLNEILTNSFKHGFKNRDHGRLYIKRMDDHGIKLMVGDDGVGNPNGISLENPQTFGLRIITLLASQLRAHISVSSQKGTVYTIEISGEAN